MNNTEALEPSPSRRAQDQLPELAAWVSGLIAAQHTGLAVGETPAAYAAQPPTLYLDTTIPSFLTARSSRDVNTARMLRVTRHWWREHRAHHAIFVSELVVEEASGGDAQAARRRLDSIASFPQLHRSEQSYELAGRIHSQSRLPARAYSDAHHVAIAALSGVRVLLTWNCAHLANANMIPLIRRACEAYGYGAPDIYTPEQLIGVCAYGRSGS